MSWVSLKYRIFGAEMADLSDDETVAKMGHTSMVVRSDVGYPSGLEYKRSYSADKLDASRKNPSATMSSR
jgi:hypothetical protein